jgi:hypothetical protein
MKRNLFLLPSTIAVYLMILPNIESLITEYLNTKRVNDKAVVSLVFLTITASFQSVLRYNEQDGIYTPNGIPGRDRDSIIK